MSKTSSAGDDSGHLSPAQIRAKNREKLPPLDDLAEQILKEMVKAFKYTEMSQTDWAKESPVALRTLQKYCKAEKPCINWITLELMARGLGTSQHVFHQRALNRLHRKRKA